MTIPDRWLDSICQGIESAALPPIPQLEQRRKSWISDALWRLVNQLNALRRLPGTMNQTVHRRLSRSLKSFFQEDRKQQEATAGALAEAELSEGQTREAWKII